MTIKLYNSRTKKVEEFKSLEENKVKMYSCGPTVYDHAHLGNLRAFIFADILRKTLEIFDYKVSQVMNITDFGHLKGDSDHGEDKMSLGLKREGLPKTIEGMKMLADKYTNLFFEDIKKLNIKPANFYPRAIEHIKIYIQIIKGLEEKGFTYKTTDGIYFDTSKDKNYGYMSLLDKSKNNLQARINENNEKKNIADFALWKFSDEKLSAVGFPSPWGEGFPGWHIECSGMVLEYLGEQIDIHTGGVDHINIHHTNEIAQSENYTGKTYSTFFCHNEFLDVHNEKMSKSLNNFLTLKNIEENNFNPLSFRYLTLQNHYRQKMNFTFDNLKASEIALNKLKKFVEKIRTTISKGEEVEHVKQDKISKKYWEKFLQDLQNDLHTPKALATLWTLIKDKSVSDEEKYWTLLEMDKVFSLDLK